MTSVLLKSWTGQLHWIVCVHCLRCVCHPLSVLYSCDVFHSRFCDTPPSVHSSLHCFISLSCHFSFHFSPLILPSPFLFIPTHISPLPVSVSSFYFPSAAHPSPLLPPSLTHPPTFHSSSIPSDLLFSSCICSFSLSRPCSPASCPAFHLPIVLFFNNFLYSGCHLHLYL